MAQLPGPAVELIALHLARSSTGPNLGGLDPRRCVLPLVCRSWRRTLQLTPGLWEEVLICTKDLFPAHTSGCPPPDAAASLAARPSAAISCWFAARAGQVERLTIQLKWSPVHCRSNALQSALTDVLANCSASLRCLHLEVAGAPLLVCRVWEQLAAGPGFPQLQELALCLEGSHACSQAANVRHAVRALEAVGQHRKLERLSVTLRGIKLVQLPAQVESLPQLHSLELRYDPQLPTLLLPLAVGDTGGALPPTLRHLLLDSPPLRSEAAVELASKLPLLQSFQLVRR